MANEELRAIPGYWEFIFFNSLAQAAEYMGLSKDAGTERLQPKMFGKLIADRFELRFANDPTPWFYESRDELVPPCRYLITVKDPEGVTNEFYSNASLLKGYQLYDSPSKSVESLVDHGNKRYPGYEFSYRDSYTEERHRETRKTKPSFRMSIRATRGHEVLDFSSLTNCAKYFQVDRSSIMGRLSNGRTLDGWSFIELPL